MTAAVLCTGTELTRGEVVNTNASWLASKLTDAGFDVTAIDAVDDDRERTMEALRRLGQAHQVIACTGGLGPTTDDLTSECAARVAGVSLVRDPQSIVAIQERFQLFKRPMGESNLKQADFPSGSIILPNSVGTAPGFALRIGKALALFFPGVPTEMKRMWNEHADSMVRQIARATTHQIRLRTYGQGESSVGQMLSGVEALHPGVTIGYRAIYPEIEVKVFARGHSKDDATQRAERATLEVKQILGPLVIAEGEVSFVGAMASVIRSSGATLALAESCTGGLLSELVTSEPASDYFLGSAVTYANEAKVRLLGVPEDLLEKHGAVSSEVAQAMAQGICRATGASIGAAITGIAGPSGGSEDKPVGLVFYAVCHRDKLTVNRRVFVGDRTRIQRGAAFATMALVMETLGGKA